MNQSVVQSALMLLFAATFAWSGAAYGLSCICETAAGACVECCGAQTSGFRRCSKPVKVGLAPLAHTPDLDTKDVQESAAKAIDKSGVIDKALKGTGGIAK